MSTAVFEVARSISSRVAELQRFTNLAVDAEENNEGLFNSLCRACCVLLAAHLEGFVKELSKALISDLQYNLKSFSNMPDAMKRTFCERIAFYEGVPRGEIDQRVRQLKDFFSVNSVAIDFQAFSYKENKNRNPGPDVVNDIFFKIGVPSVLNSISGGRLERIFENDSSLNYSIRRDIRRYISNFYSFPFRRLPENYIFNYRSVKPLSGGNQNDKVSLWHTFIEEVMQRRHSIVHGDTMANETNLSELKRDLEKMEVLMYSILYSSAGYLCSAK